MQRILLAGLLFFGSTGIGLAAERPPNIVLMFADDLGYADLACYGNKTIRTPNLDQLAKDGIRFTHFYVPQAVCSASRAALLTGCYPNRIGILGALGPASKNGIAATETTLGEMLQAKGYRTAIFGKWHLGHHPQFLPTQNGFDEYYGLPYSNDMWPKHPTAKFPDLPLIEMTKTIAVNPDQRQLTTDYTTRAVQFIEKNKDKPFFVYVPHNMPHVPLFAPDARRGQSKAGLYGDVIEEIDASMGSILATLKKHDLANNTLVIFTSDNGPWLSYGNHAGSAGPLREGKGTSMEGGVRVPFIARWPGQIPAGKECHEPAMTIDLLPTIAHATGASLPKLPIDGKDISALLRNTAGAKSPHEAYYFYWGRELQAVRMGQWKLHFPHAYNTLKTPGNDGKPGPYASVKIEQALYDLVADVGETKNLVRDQPEVVARITALAEKMRAELGDSATKQNGTAVRPPGLVAEAPAKK